MGLSRSILLTLSENRWLRARAPGWWFVRKASGRFMPGYTLDDALSAAQTLRGKGINTVLTELGEDITDTADAREVTVHYLAALTRILTKGLDCQPSVKLTQLGLTVDPEQCYTNLRLLVERAHRQDTFVWIDMEQLTYLERTLDLYRRILGEFPNVGVCLQAYLYRTSKDLASLLPFGGGIRLVKGAYREPASAAYPKKSDVDANFVKLADQMLAVAGRPSSPRLVFGTHDRRMVDAVSDLAERASLGRDAYEFHLLFGIQRALQERLAGEGHRVRVLISYGDQWFAWYMRRLAERPANVLFALRAMFS